MKKEKSISYLLLLILYSEIDMFYWITPFSKYLVDQCGKNILSHRLLLLTTLYM